MPAVKWNADIWDGSYDWSNEGDEWSEAWGSTESLWQTTVLPRIKNFIPSGTILEIAPGFGRITQYLQTECDELVLVDLSSKCIAACQERFRYAAGVEYHVNDGKDLSMVRDNSIDFAFSYDSLVHVDSEALDAYIVQLGQKLTPDGVAFLHHSNCGEYRRYYRVVGSIPRGKTLLSKLGLIQWPPRGRSMNVTGESVRRTVEGAGMLCRQELINFGGGSNLLDCFTTIYRPGSLHATSRETIRNRRFWKEVVAAKRSWVNKETRLPPN